MEEKQFLLMDDSLMPNVEFGTKKITIRKGVRDIKKGKLFIHATNGTYNSLEANVTSVQVFKFSDVPTEMLLADGFKDLDDSVEQMKKFYPDISKESEVTVIMWE